MSNEEGWDVITRLYAALNRPVILPIPLGEKGPVFKGWPKMKWEGTQEELYKQRVIDAIERGGNLGILLGEDSENLVALDFDEDPDMNEFFRVVPWARNSMITRGEDGCQVWFYIDGWYPKKRVIIKESEPGKATVEFRGGGGLQSVVYGKHPAGMRYVWNGIAPIHIEYVDLAEWLGIMQGKRVSEDGPTREGQQVDYEWLKRFPGANIRELDLIGLLKSQGVIVKKVDDERHAIQCPWHKSHTSGSGQRDAVVFQFLPRGQWFPAFKCLHAHCVNRGLKDLLEWLEVQPPDVMKWCRTQWKKISIEECQENIGRYREEPELPRQIVEGVLYEKTKMMLAGPPKIRKSWLAMDMALSIVLGEPWLGFDTCQSRVLFLNMEIPREFFAWRMFWMQEARGIVEMPDGGLTALHLRGSNAFDGTWKELAEYCVRHGPYAVLFIDTIYKTFGPRDENSASEMADLLRNVDMVSNASGAAIVQIHHFAKGQYMNKDVGDRASGSGVLYRDPDSFMTMAWADPKAKVYDEGRIDIRARLQKPQDPIGIRWKDYRWLRDGSVNIETKSNKERREPKKTQQDIMIDILKMYMKTGGLRNKEWKELAAIEEIDANSFNYSLRRLKEDKRIIEQPDGKYIPATL